MIEYIALTAGVLTIIMTTLLVIVFIIYPQLRVVEFKMVVLMCIGSLIQTFSTSASIIWGMSLSKDKPSNIIMCDTLGLIEVVGAQMSFIWTFNICYMLKNTLIDKMFDVNKWWTIIVLIGIIEPVSLALIPLLQTGHGYGLAEYSLYKTDCFIKDESGWEKFTMAISFFIPLWVILAYSIKSIFEIWAHLKSMKECNPRLKKRVQHLFWYPIVMSFCWSWLSVYRIWNWVDPNSGDWLSQLAFVLTNLNGGLNVLIYYHNSLKTRLGFKGALLTYKSEAEDEYSLLTPSMHETPLLKQMSLSEFSL